MISGRRTTEKGRRKTEIWNSAGAQTWGRLQLGDGVLLDGFEPGCDPAGADLRAALAEAVRSERMRLGCTEGEVVFTAAPTFGDTVPAGQPWDGPAAFTRMSARPTGVLREVTRENLLRLMPWGVGNGVHLTVRQDARFPCVIRSLCWAGVLSGGGLLLIRLRNAVNRAGLCLRTGGREEGRLPFDFLAQAGENEAQAPFDLWLTDREEADA